MKFLSMLLATLVMALLIAPAAFAEHPDTDDANRTLGSGNTYKPGDEVNPDPWQRRDNPNCDMWNENGEYEALDGEFWDCIFDPGIPGVPGSGGHYWEPDPADYGPTGGDVEWAKKWSPASIPGYTGVAMRLLTRSEWANPDLALTKLCPQAGCHYKGGADINLRRNGVPFNLNTTWFNNARQLYVWNATTKVWDLKEDTGWRTLACAVAPCYSSKMIGTIDYGTAKYGAAWYYIRGWGRVWDGSAWSLKVSLDPVAGGGSLGVWDPKPGDATPKPPAPTRRPPLKAPKGGSLTPVVGAPTAG